MGILASGVLWAAATASGYAQEKPAGFRKNEFQSGQNVIFAQELPPESLEANLRLMEYLRGNAKASETLRRMADRIKSFKKRAPRLFVSKCIDGRVHGSDGKGYPITTVTFSRTDGNKVALDGGGNAAYWQRLDSVVNDAEEHTPGCPALFIALGHSAPPMDPENPEKGTKGSGCAAHHENDELALKAVSEQATAVQQIYKPSELYALHGMTNTYDGAERIIFPGGQELNTEKIISLLDTQEFPLKQSSDVFKGGKDGFLTSVIDDVVTKRLVSDRKPGEIMEGPDAAMFTDLECTVAMESYLLEEVSRITVNKTRNNVVFNQRLFDHIRSILETVDGLPEQLKPALLYQTLWNVAYTLHRRNRNTSLETNKDKKIALEIEHAEDKVAYGEGFEIEPRNTVVLVKPGRGDDLEALKVAKTVLLKNRHNRKEQQHPPLIHINVQVTGVMESWEDYNQKVLSKLRSMTRNAHMTFGDDCRILTSYCYLHEKQFYPVRLKGDPTTEKDAVRESYPCNVTATLNDDNFSANALRLREDAYTNSILAS